jgi:hypothetical protein
VVFDQNTLAGDWRKHVRSCKEQQIALHRDIAFALAIADLLELPDDVPLLPAVAAVLPIPICLRDPASLGRPLLAFQLHLQNRPRRLQSC